MNDERIWEAIRIARQYAHEIVGKRDPVIFDMQSIRQLGNCVLLISIRPPRYLFSVHNEAVSVFMPDGKIKPLIYLN
jgi:hypothetical protein